MIPRPQAGTQRPPPPQPVPGTSTSTTGSVSGTVSGSGSGSGAGAGTGTGSHRPLNRPTLPSKLSNVRSASQQQGNVARQPSASQHGIKQEVVSVKPEVIELDVDHETQNGHDAVPAPVYTKPLSATSYHAEGQSPRPWDAATHPLPSSPLPPPKHLPLPLPSRPSFLTDSTKRQSRPSSTASRARRDPARRSSGLCAPAVATALPNGKVADFFPWTGVPGAHPEDVMNENSVRNGNNDKGVGPGCPNIAAESNTARPNLWPQLKGKQGLHLLSMLFCQVLDKRQQMGRCTAPSTFKPPPRVTLTDTKREAWLKDLANPDVPLRRLSRTIPHGIRGKVLLDHCISKDIPISRAVWLAKCVGANEIRAFKRKGVSGSSALAGEIKWIREWTVYVEEFIDGVIGECGQPGWSKKMNYAVRLATYFFSDHLLDTEHYIDWLLKSLETSSAERLPVWVLLMQVYWKFLTSQRKQGRRLSEALLAHAQILLRNGHTSNSLLVARIFQLVSVLAIAHQGCLVIPKAWRNHQETFENIASLDKFATAKSAISNTSKRNLRITGSTDSSASWQKHAKQALINTLDNFGLDGNIPRELFPPDVPMQTSDHTLDVVLEWATSRHREGMARVYLATRILRHWNMSGADTDSILLQMLETATADPSIDSKPLHEIIALLARSRHFSVGKYLQWLISTGALSGIPAVSADAQLLLDLPTQHLQQYVLNLRRTILSRMGYSAQSEMQELEKHEGYLSSVLYMASSETGSPMPSVDRMTPPSTPSGAIRWAIGQWLCDQVTVPRHDGMGSANDGRVFKGSLQVFCVVRQTLEQFQDFQGLSVCISAACECTFDSQLLATIADTLNMHADVFAAMGVLGQLVHRLYNQQQELRRRLPLDKTFLLALSSLVQRVPTEDSVRHAVAADLQYCEMQSSAAACSPASDSMVMTTGGVPESDEDICRVLASGNTMDEHLFTRMFGIIADRAMKAGMEGVPRSGAWFSQLRRFDTNTFDQLLQALMNRLKEPSFTVQTFIEVTAALVGSGCMKLDLPFRTLERNLSLAKEPAMSARLAQISLELVLPLQEENPLRPSPELYRFQLEQMLFRDGHPDDVFRMLLLLLGGRSTDLPHGTDYAVDRRVVKCLRHHVNSTRKITMSNLTENLHSLNDGTQMQRLLEQLINPTGIGRASASNPVSRVQRILACANELSLQACKLALKHCFLSTPFSEEDRLCLSQVFRDAIEEESTVWSELLSALDEQLVYQIRSWARDRAITLMSEFVSSTDSSVKIDEIKRYLTAADNAPSSTGSQARQTQTVSSLNEHLVSLGKLIDETDPLDVTQAPQRQRIGFGLDVILQLTAKQFLLSVDSLASSSEVVTLTSTLCLLLIHQKLQNQRGTLEYILDVVSLIVDELSSEAMTSIVRNLPAFARNDPRIRYLFGITFSPDSWLALASKVYAQTLQTPANQTTQASIPSSLPRPSHPLPPRPGSNMQRTPSMGNMPSQQQMQPARPNAPPQGPRGNYEIKYNPFQIRRWEIMPDPTPNMGANDTSLSLGLFQARKVS